MDRPRAGRRAAAWAPALVLALLVLPTNVYLLAWRVIELRRPASDLYVTADESAALDALAVTTGPADVALAVESVGRWVPNQGAHPRLPGPLGDDQPVPRAA